MELRNRIMLPPHGAAIRGVFRLPHFTERASMYADAIHAGGAWATSQLVLQGGMPHAPSVSLANYTNNNVPHELTVDEIRWLVDEYAFSGKQMQAAGLDGLELHANHEELLQLFMSPATNLHCPGAAGHRPHRLPAWGDRQQLGRAALYPASLLRPRPVVRVGRSLPPGARHPRHKLWQKLTRSGVVFSLCHEVGRALIGFDTWADS